MSTIVLSGHHGAQLNRLGIDDFPGRLRSAFGVKPITEDPQTLRDVLAETFKPILIETGLLSGTIDGVEAEEEEAA